MLSVVSIKKSSIDTNYYLKQDGNYYIEDVKEKELYQWMGDGVKRLGLEGAINPRDHSNIFNGILPDNTLAGKRNSDGSLSGRPGYDLTFSMNKELSLIVCCTNDKQLRDYFLNAHINAVKMAMNEVEKLVSARKTTDGVTEYEFTKNMVASLCTHFSSRAGDPQVHTHALVANLTQRLDGHWRALSTDMQRKYGFYEKVRDMATFLGHIYQNEMARATKEKGFNLTPVNKHGMFAIEGFPEDVKQHFSKRRQQIVNIIESLAYADKNDKILNNNIAQHSKPSKEKINHHDFMEKSKTSMYEYINSHYPSKSFDQIIHDCIKQKDKSNITLNINPLEYVIDAINYLSRFNVNLDANRIVEKAMEFNFGAISTSALQESLTGLIRTGELKQTSSGNFALQSQIDTEKRLIQKIVNIQPVRPINHSDSDITINDTLQNGRMSVIDEPRNLNEKMAMLDTLIKNLEAQGKKVTILTQTKSLSLNHNAHDQSRHRSIWQRLKNLNQADHAKTLYGFLYQDEKSRPKSFLTRQGKEVFIIDEGQLLSLDASEKLLYLIEKRQAKIIFLNFEQGRQSSLASNFISLLKKTEIPVINMADDHSKKQSVNFNVKINSIEGSLNATTQENQFHRQKVIAEQVVQKFGNRLNEVDMLSDTKKSANKQTELIRNKLREIGILGIEEQKIMTEHAIYLTKEEQKYAKFFKKGWIAKTYVGNGQFKEKTILRIDKPNNRLLIKEGFSQSKYVTPRQLLKSTDVKLVEYRELIIATHDRVKINAENKISKQLGLSINTTYKVILDGKKISLIPEDDKLKTIKTKMTNLNGIDATYDYVKTLNQVHHLKKSTKQVILDMPAYSLNKNTIYELSRQYQSIDIYTDDPKKAEKKINIEVTKPLASELTTIPFRKEPSLVKKAVNYGISVIASREAAFTYQSVVERALSYGNTVGFNEVQQELLERVRAGELLVRKTPNHDILIATRETVILEQSIIQQIKDGKNAVTPFLSESTIQQKLDTSNLTQGQKDACVLLATTNDRFVMIQGYAGTGKSTMLQTLQDALIQSGTMSKASIIALAPTHKAVHELKEKGIEAQTLKSFLVDEANLSSSNFQHLENKLILLDESSMVSNRDFQQLQSIVENAKTCHCAYIGDKAQLLSVEAGKPSEVVYISREANIAIATMNEVLRQQNPKLKRITHELMTSTPKSVTRAFNLLEQNNLISDCEKTDPIQEIAAHYCSLSPDERANTLIAAATNQNRQEINHAIRIIRQKNGELRGESISSTILVDSRLTDAELRHAPNYKVGDVVRLNNIYLEIEAIDFEKNTLILHDPDKLHKVLNLDLMPKHTLLELFHRSIIDVQSGDLLKWTKSDKSRNLTAHEQLLVTGVNKVEHLITATAADGKQLTIDLKQPQNQHMDFNYASTVHGLQGATAQSTLILLDSRNKISNNMRLLYVAVTRSTHQVQVFTNNLEEVRTQIIGQPGDKRSALEALGLLEIKKEQILNHNPKNTQNNMDATHFDNYINDVSHKYERIDAKKIEDELRHEAKYICENILGKPNQSLSNATNWRYGSKGSLSIIVDGQHQGSFHNFETGEKGGMIHLLMSELGLDFKTAMAQGSHMLGGTYTINPKSKMVNSSPAYKDNVDTRKLAYINKLIEQSLPLKGTIAEKYLANRAIQDMVASDLRFIHRIRTGKGNQDIVPTAAALLAIARDKEGNSKAIQVTYLDEKSGTKIDALQIKKRTIGSLKTATVNLSPAIKKPDFTLVAEGVETGLSIRDAIPVSQKDHIQVLVSLGKSNLPNIVDERSANKIVLALDNDKQDWRQDKAIQSAITLLEKHGKSVVCIQPQLLNDQKTDYNDLAKAGRFEDIKKDVIKGWKHIQEKDQVVIPFDRIPTSPKIDKSIGLDRER